MVETKVPKDLRIYKSKVVGSLSLRQLICLAIAVVVDVALWFFIFTNIDMGIRIKIILTIFVDLPIMAFSFDVQGMKMEDYLREIIKCNFLAPVKRKAKTDLSNGTNVAKPIDKKHKKELEAKYKQFPQMVPYK